MTQEEDDELSFREAVYGISGRGRDREQLVNLFQKCRSGIIEKVRVFFVFYFGC